MIKKYLFLSVVILAALNSARAQQKLGDFGGTYNFLNSKWTGSVDFNQTAGSQGTSNPDVPVPTYLYVFPNTGSPFIGFQPSISEAFGNGTKDSINNFQGSVYADCDVMMPNTINSFLKFHLGPTASMDLTSSYGIIAGEISAGYYCMFGGTGSIPVWTLYPYFDLKYGIRWFNDKAPTNYEYLAPIIMVTWVPSSTFSFDLTVKDAKLSNELGVPNGMDRYLAADVTWKFSKAFGLTVKYVNGEDEPQFKIVNTLSLGFSWVN